MAANGPSYEKEGMFLGIGLALLIIPIFVAPPQGVSCGINVMCYYDGLTDFGRFATFAGLIMITASIVLAIKKGTTNQS